MNHTARALMALSATWGLPAHAQDWPQRPIRMVVAFAPGGTTDFTARVVAPRLSEALGQTIVVDNRPGAGSIIGTEVVARASPDGHTIQLADTTFGIIQAIHGKLPFHVQKDFAPVSQVMSVPNCLVVHPAVPARSVKELVALAQAKPAGLTFGSGGVGTPLHMTGEQLKLAARVDMTHVPYKGAGPALTDLIGGQLTMIFPTLTVALPHVRGGRLRVLAVTSTRRAAALPETPTMVESGYPDITTVSWFGIVAPARTPGAVLARLAKEAQRVATLADVRERIESQHGEVVAGSAEQMGRMLAGEIAQWQAVARAGKIRVDGQ